MFRKIWPWGVLSNPTNARMEFRCGNQAVKSCGDQQIGAAAAVMRTLYQSVMMKCKRKALNLPLDLCPCPHLWSRAVGND